MTDKIHLDIVSIENALFSGNVKAVFVTGTYGELGIYPGHSPLLTTLRPGEVRLLTDKDEEEIFYINGGMLEVQPNIVTVLADSAIRAHDLDEAAALEAKKRAEDALANKQSDFDYSLAAKELAEAIAQIRAAQKVRKQHHV